MNNIEKSNDKEIIEKEGKKFYKIPTNWTEREYFSHDGPGWDYKAAYLENKGLDPFDPHYLDKLSNDIYYTYEEVEEDE